MFWELSRHPTWQDRVRIELETHLTDTISPVPTWEEVQELPILDAIITEALRLHPAAPASLPRRTPDGGRTLDGYFVPQDVRLPIAAARILIKHLQTVVSMQCYTTQRDGDVFQSPDSFVPERWLQSDKVTDQMRELHMPFSKGSRACLGKNLAMMELKLTAAALLKSFVVKSGPTTTEDSMAMKDHFLVLPKGGRCDLVFEAVLVKTT